jgi:hypothetical protein
VELWPSLRRHAEASRALQDARIEADKARSELTMAKIPYKLRWEDIDSMLIGL